MNKIAIWFELMIDFEIFFEEKTNQRFEFSKPLPFFIIKKTMQIIVINSCDLSQRASKFKINAQMFTYSTLNKYLSFVHLISLQGYCEFKRKVN